MNIFEWDENIPVTANNLNEMQYIINGNISESIKNQYDIETNGAEVKVGYKVDGKDVYAKRFEFSSLTNGLQISHGLSNFKLIDWDGMTLYQGTWRKLPYPLSNGYYVFNIDDTYITYYASSELPGLTGNITLYYTYNS